MNYFPSLKFEGLILCEYMTLAKKYTGAVKLASGSVNRRDIWPSREEAYKLLKARPAWKVWDDRVLQIYVKDGMRPLPTADYPDKTDGVTLKCSRIQETVRYPPLVRIMSHVFVGLLSRSTRFNEGLRCPWKYCQAVTRPYDIRGHR